MLLLLLLPMKMIDKSLLPLQDGGSISVSRILDLSSPVFQLSTRGTLLAVATETCAVVCDTANKTYREVGAERSDGELTWAGGASRRGLYGVAFVSDTSVVCSRPGCRLWLADVEDGAVRKTAHLRQELEEGGKELELDYVQDMEVLRVSKRPPHSFAGGAISSVIQDRCL